MQVRHHLGGRAAVRSEAGFSLIELLISTGVMLVISATVTSALLQMTSSQRTIWNRTAMHAGIRSATELLQQEIGQAGRISLATADGFTSITNNAIGGPGAATTTLGSVSGIYVGEQLTFGANASVETVTVTAVDTTNSTVSAVFSAPLGHPVGTPVTVYGGFADGILPTTAANGSSGNVLKLYGDVNGDGNMVYVEYTCDFTTGNLYRNMVAFDAGAKPAVTEANILLSNIQAYPTAAPVDCFVYQQKTVNGQTFVTDVAITLTVQTQNIDPVTKQYQLETKALLNVSPRNIVNAWELASLSNPPPPRVQARPASITALLPPVS